MTVEQAKEIVREKEPNAREARIHLNGIGWRAIIETQWDNGEWKYLSEYSTSYDNAWLSAAHRILTQQERRP